MRVVTIGSCHYNLSEVRSSFLSIMAKSTHLESSRRVWLLGSRIVRRHHKRPARVVSLTDSLGQSFVVERTAGVMCFAQIVSRTGITLTCPISLFLLQLLRNQLKLLTLHRKVLNDSIRLFLFLVDHLLKMFDQLVLFCLKSGFEGVHFLSVLELGEIELVFQLVNDEVGGVRLEL